MVSSVKNNYRLLMILQGNSRAMPRNKSYLIGIFKHICTNCREIRIRYPHTTYSRSQVVRKKLAVLITNDTDEDEWHCPIYNVLLEGNKSFCLQKIKRNTFCGFRLYCNFYCCGPCFIQGRVCAVAYHKVRKLNILGCKIPSGLWTKLWVNWLLPY